MNLTDDQASSHVCGQEEQLLLTTKYSCSLSSNLVSFHAWWWTWLPDPLCNTAVTWPSIYFRTGPSQQLDMAYSGQQKHHPKGIIRRLIPTPATHISYEMEKRPGKSISSSLWDSLPPFIFKGSPGTVCCQTPLPLLWTGWGLPKATPSPTNT